MGPCGGLSFGHFCISEQGGVVVDVAVAVENPAVAVVGELVQAQISHQNGAVAKLATQRAQCDVEDAVRVLGPGALRVLVRGDAVQHQPADSGLDRLDGRFAQRLLRVLDDARHRGDGNRLGGVLADEHREHEIRRA